jgi:hypothetical protein
MKNLFRVGIVVASVILLAGCGEDPGSTARAFTENLSKGKITEAKEYSTEQTGMLLDMASSMGSLPVDPDFEFIFVSQTIEGNNATVKFKEKEDGKVEEIELIRVDGEWKVHIKKDW